MHRPWSAGLSRLLRTLPRWPSQCAICHSWPSQRVCEACVQRFAALRGRGWRTRLEQAMAERLSDAQGQIALSFEIIYGHAFKPAPRVRLQANTSVALEDMRTMLRSKSAKAP